MADAKRAPARAPQISSYAPHELASTQHNEKLCQLVLSAIAHLEAHDWHPDLNDIRNFGSGLQKIARAEVQAALDSLVQSKDLVCKLRIPPHCRRARPCYQISKGRGRKKGNERRRRNYIRGVLSSVLDLPSSIFSIEREAKLLRTLDTSGPMLQDCEEEV
jgi:hypothetical protein